MKTDKDFKRWFKRYWYLNDWLKARKFDVKKLNKIELLKGLASRNRYISKCCQEEFAEQISGPIMKVIEEMPTFSSLYK